MHGERQRNKTKERKNLSLTVGLKFCTMNITSAKKNEVVSELLARNILIKSLAQVGKSCAACIHVWSHAPDVIVQWSIRGSLGFQSMVLSTYYKSCIIEYLHKQQHLIGLART